MKFFKLHMLIHAILSILYDEIGALNAEDLAKLKGLSLISNLI